MQTLSSRAPAGEGGAMRVIGRTTKGTPVELVEHGAGSYYYRIAEHAYHIFQYRDCSEAPWLRGFWSLSETGQWYSDPIWSKREAVEVLIETANTHGY